MRTGYELLSDRTAFCVVAVEESVARAARKDPKASFQARLYESWIEVLLPSPFAGE